MKLSVGMRVIDTRTAELRRWQVVDFDATAVRVRPLRYIKTLDGRGPMEWTIPVEFINAPPVGWLRTNFDRCFTEDA